MLFALARSAGLKWIGVALPCNTAAPVGVSQIFSELPGHLMSNESPHTLSKSGRYTAWVSRNAMQAVSEKPISPGQTGGPCACSESARCNLYPVARASQKFPPKKAFCVVLYSSTGKSGE